MSELLRILVTFMHDSDEDETGDVVEVETDPTKNTEEIKSLSDGSFLTLAVISNAVEIVAHNSEAAISIVKKYGDQALVTMIDTYVDNRPKVSGSKVDNGMLNEMLKYMKGGQSN